MSPPACTLEEVGSQQMFEVVVDSLQVLLVAGSKRLVVVGDVGCQHQHCNTCQAAEPQLQADAHQLGLQKFKK